MSKIRENIRDNTILYRMIRGTMLLAAVMVFGLTFFLSHASEKALQEEIFRSQQQDLQLIANIVDFRAEYANYLMQLANRDKSISQLFYPTEGKDIVPALQDLAELRQGVKQLHSIYIYNEYDEKIYSTSSTLSYASTSIGQFGDEAFLKILENISSYPKYSPILRRTVEEKPNGQRYEEYVYTYLLYDAYSSGAIKNIMAFNFHAGWMGEAMTFITNQKRMADSIWILDRNRQIVYSSNGSLIGTQADTERFPDTIYQDSSGYLLRDEKRAHFMLIYATPSRPGYDQWTFVSLNDYSELIAPINQLRRLAYSIAFGALMIGMAMSIILSRRMYQPVRQTINKMEDLQRDQARKLELERVMNLRKLFQGSLTDESSKTVEILQQSGIHYNMEQDNRVLLICVDYLSSFMIRNRRQLEKTDAQIEKVIRKCVEESYPEHILVKMQEGLWSVCVPAEEIVQVARIQRLFDGINQQLSRLLDLTVSIAVSPLGHSAGDIPFQYVEAHNTLSLRFLLGQNRLLTPEETDEYGKEKFIYPHETEEKMIACMFSGKAREAEGFYKQFVDQIRFCTVSDIRIAFILLANSVKRASSNTITEVSSVLMAFDQFHQKLQMLETLDEVNQMFLHLIWEITEKTQGYAQKKYEQLIQQVKDYVAENYGGSSLSMDEVADHVGMSAAYLGRLFKQLTGVTFTEYLTKYRLDTACDMLLNTTKTVNDISDSVGFTNSSYFYIVFKKNLGCTPNQYRKQNE